ncbi:MAG: hypothetical protein Fur0022_39990 [Anaerolineales bacterium]
MRHNLRRPFSVTLLAIGVLTLAMVGLVRAGQAVHLWDFLNALEVSPGYLAVSGLFAGLAGLPAVWGLWHGLRWSSRYTLIYISAVLVFFWVDRLLMTQAQSVLVNTPFALGITFLIAFFTAWVLSRKPARAFFQ